MLEQSQDQHCETFFFIHICLYGETRSVGLKPSLSMWLQVGDTVDCDWEQEDMTHPVTNRYVLLLTHLLSDFSKLNLSRGVHSYANTGHSLYSNYTGKSNKDTLKCYHEYTQF